MKVFVTGGAGQIGSTVADLLLARGDTVLAGATISRRIPH
jgi:UDP-glucose 4-epimerase